MAMSFKHLFYIVSRNSSKENQQPWRNREVRPQRARGKKSVHSSLPAVRMFLCEWRPFKSRRKANSAFFPCQNLKSISGPGKGGRQILFSPARPCGNWWAVSWACLIEIGWHRTRKGRIWFSILMKSRHGCSETFHLTPSTSPVYN